MDFHILVVAAMFLFYGAVNGAKEDLRIGDSDMAIPDNNSEKPPRVMTLVIAEDIEESEETNPFMENKAPMLPWIENPQIMLPRIENPQIMLPWIENPQIMLPRIENPQIMLPRIENPQIMLPWIESVKPKDYEAYDDDEDTSGESNSDEYSDTDTELDSDNESATDSEIGTDSESDTDKESNYYHEDDYLKNKIMKNIVKLNVDSNSKVLRNRWKSCQKTASKYCRQACVASYKNACAEHECKKKLKKALKKQCKRNCKEFFVET